MGNPNFNHVPQLTVHNLSAKDTESADFQECVSGLHVYSNMLAVGFEKADGALIAAHENL